METKSVTPKKSRHISVHDTRIHLSSWRIHTTGEYMETKSVTSEKVIRAFAPAVRARKIVSSWQMYFWLVWFVKCLWVIRVFPRAVCAQYCEVVIDVYVTCWVRDWLNHLSQRLLLLYTRANRAFVTDLCVIHRVRDLFQVKSVMKAFALCVQHCEFVTNLDLSRGVCSLCMSHLRYQSVCCCCSCSHNCEFLPIVSSWRIYTWLV